MKKSPLLLFFLFFATFSKAQSPYIFSHSTSIYQDLTNPTVIADTVTWSLGFARVNIPLGFNFEIFDHALNTMTLFTFDGSLSGPTTSNAVQIGRLFYSNRADFVNGEVSKLSYKTEGSPNSRVCKIEMNNFGLYDGETSDYVNLQIWLYENINAIELRYGSSSIQHPSALFPDGGPFVFLSYEGNNPDYAGCSLSGLPTNPTLNQVSIGAGLSSYPTTGTVYRFDLISTAIKETKRVAGINIYPNPSTDNLTITSEQHIQTATLYNLLGEQVMQLNIGAKAGVLDIARLPKGIYLLKIKGTDFETTERLVKE